MVGDSSSEVDMEMIGWSPLGQREPSYIEQQIPWQDVGPSIITVQSSPFRHSVILNSKDCQHVMTGGFWKSFAKLLLSIVALPALASRRLFSYPGIDRMVYHWLPDIPYDPGVAFFHHIIVAQ